VELLWDRAGEVDVHLASYRSRTSGSLGKALEQTADVGTINATVGRLTAGPVTLLDVSLRKRGDVLRATAILTQANLQAALPAGLEVKPVASGDGELVLQGSALGLTVDATLSARGGVLRITPDVPLIGGLLTLTVFQDPRVDVEAVGARSVSGGYSMFATARLR
jgi:hypothetical protein